MLKKLFLKLNSFTSKVIILFLDCYVHFLSCEHAIFISLNKRFGDIDDNVSG
ncbi:hypothetical protein HMPREF1608_04567 [Escherichia coli 908525]|uniref:Uncharacterized protein n=1 Tax=Escherichia coli (strain SMS-3-5 / SECEC) TaxID=439855 RepID=B1LJH8_ECOSM|nr:hypothetical protein EcSMS35_0464 [Escherichia coli SMS-3-5]EFK21362.1 hypothetical protein HMPREF9530_02002 [Escherichia coli MS 21-1]ESD05046.1 hypothetical protein HMPREF1595_03964 [Escherichia coli 907672]ESD64749.1 hypothetical protein HMPREF1608_04567 [Escherichia coli 908525]